MKCYHCKAEIMDDDFYCSKCGSPQKFTDYVKRALNNDQMATTKLYEMTYNNVYQTIRTVARLDEDTVFDLVQNTYVKAFNSLSQLNEPEAFRGWIKTISRNLTIDYLRKKKVIVFSQMVSVDSDEMIEFEDDKIENLPEVVMDRKETERLIQEILSELSEEQRLAVFMHYFEGLSIKEIANTLGVSEGTIKSRLNYGRKKIEIGVRELEKKGTKLYSLAPVAFLLLLFRSQEAYAAEMPNAEILQNVHKQLSSGVFGPMGTEGNTLTGEKTVKITGEKAVKESGKTAAKTTAAKAAAGAAGKGAAVKVIAGLAAVGVVGAGAVGITSMNKDSNTPNEPAAHNEETVDAEKLRADAEKYFKGILEKYEDACQNGYDMDEHGMVSEEALYMVNMYGENIYFTYKNIDHNGYDELLIGVGNGEYVRLGGIYAYSPEIRTMPLDNFNERTEIHLLDDGSIFENGGSSASEGYVRLSRLAEDGVSPETVFFYNYEYSEAGITYFENGGNEITEAEYKEQLAGKTEVTDFEWRLLEMPDMSAETEANIENVEDMTEIESLAGFYVHSEAEIGIDTVINVTAKDANTLVLEFDFSGRMGEYIFEAVREGGCYKSCTEIPSGTAIMTVTPNGDELIIEGNDIYNEHAYPRLDATYVKIERNYSY